jgi:CRP-like cAMP-binding protein
MAYITTPPTRAPFIGGLVREGIEHRWPENELLAALSAKDRNSLLPQLEILTLYSREYVQRADEAINYVYFPLDSIVVLVSSVDPKATVEVGLIGREGQVGAQILMGAKKATNEALILWEGKALRIPVSVLKREFKRSSAMREVLLPYANALLEQSAQIAACHSYHAPKGRMVRLLLMTADRANSNEVTVTQRFLANLLGTRRATVTNAVNQLQDKGLIQWSRGRMKIVNREGLESESCSCYQIISQQYSPQKSDLVPNPT